MFFKEKVKLVTYDVKKKGKIEFFPHEIKGIKMTYPFCLMKKFQTVFAGAVVLSAMSLFVACGDDDSPSAAPVGVYSSSTVPLSLASSSDVLVAQSSSSVEGQLPASSSVEVMPAGSSGSVVAATFSFFVNPAETGIAVVPDEDGFYDMGEVYKAVPTTSKIAFIIRHSKRQKSTGTESLLTPIGEQMALTLGGKLVGDEPFYYASTDFIRTRKTCELIATGRGETAEVVTWDGIDGAYFLTVPSDTLDAAVSKQGGSQKYIARYAYGVLNPANALEQKLQGYFYDLFERGNQFVNEVIVANMPSWKRVSVFATHDVLIEPLIVFVTNRTINLRFYERPFRWVNYLSGVAVIVDDQNRVTVLPTKGDVQGWMIPSQEIDEEAI